MNARLPENLEARTLAGMLIGETAWTMPWAMQVDRDRRCWLNPNYPAEDSPFGTVRMKVERHPHGFTVHTVSDATYRPSSLPENRPWLPVVEIIHEPARRTTP